MLNRTRLYRDGAELEPLMIDEAYDFNFQETRMLKEERQVYLVSKIFNPLAFLLNINYITNMSSNSGSTLNIENIVLLYFYLKHLRYRMISWL